MQCAGGIGSNSGDNDSNSSGKRMGSEVSTAAHAYQLHRVAKNPQFNIFEQRRGLLNTVMTFPLLLLLFLHSNC